MSYQEKSIVASMIAVIALMALLAPRIAAMYAAGDFEGADGLVLLGKTGLVFAGIGVVAVIISTILLSIVHAVLTGEGKQSFLIDERDLQIELRGKRVSDIVTGTGFFASMLALTFGYDAVTVFFMIALSFAAGEFVAGLAKLAMYRLGW
ncbi:MAG TPA: hypothetical protein ENK28_08955 [Aliiroseovarius sp.]|nr:hypothetical protein [Aliiroseovarius sp.]